MNDNHDGEMPQLAGFIDIIRHVDGSVFVSREVTARYVGTERDVSMRWNKNGEPFGTAEDGNEIKADFEEEGIYSVTVRADGFQSKTGGETIIIDENPFMEFSVPAEKEDRFRFRKLGNAAIILGVSGKKLGELVIPDTLGGLPVRGTWNRAFASKNVLTVAIPNGIAVIGEYAFFDNGLTSVTIPESVTAIGEDAFSCNDGLASITVSPDNRHLGSRDGVLYDKAGTILLLWPKAKLPVSIPAGVTRIGHRAFSDNELTSVTIPNGVTEIGEQAFEHNLLTSIDIPAGVTSIGWNAFSHNKLTSLTIPGNVKSIDWCAFYGNMISSLTISEGVTEIGGWAFCCNELTSVTIPGSVTEICEVAFGNNDGLASINVSPENKNYSSRDGVLYDRAGTAMLLWPNAKFPVTIPDGVTSIGHGVFYGRELVSIDISDSVTEIGDYAFEDNEFTSVVIPPGVTKIGKKAFSRNKLTAVILPGNLTTIGEKAFSGNFLTSVSIPGSVAVIGDEAFESNKLTSVNISEGVTGIGGYAFAYNELASITIPDSVTVIGDGAFEKNKLTSITIPAGVAEIGNCVFNDNDDLASITVSPDNKNFSSRDGVLYDKAGTTLLVWPEGKSPIVIPDGIIGIGDGAFAKRKLTSVTIPNGVTVIGDNAFSENNLTSIVIPDSVTEIGDMAFWLNRLTSITIGANVDMIDKLAVTYDAEFIAFYNANGRQAGTYVFAEENWVKTG